MLELIKQIHTHTNKKNEDINFSPIVLIFLCIENFSSKEILNADCGVDSIFNIYFNSFFFVVLFCLQAKNSATHLIRQKVFI